MFAEIVLHRRVPSNFDSFTYSVPENLKVQEGQLVKIPFRKQTILGIVRRLHSEAPKYATKAIEEVIPVILPKFQMDLANWMSEKYKCGFSKTVDFFIPEKIWRPSKKKKAKEKVLENPQPTAEKNEIKKNIKITLPKNDELKNLTKNLLKDSSKKIVIEKTRLPRAELISFLADQMPKNSQILYLLPEVFYTQKLAKNFAVFHGGLKEPEKARMWENIKNGESGIIFGTRASLFLPFKNLSAIVLDFEHNENYNEKRTPNYHALEIAEQLAKIWNIPLIAISASPRAEMWHKISKNIFNKFEWESKNAQTKVEILDMFDERRKGNYEILAEKTVEKIASCLAQNSQALLFLNRIGEASAVICEDCGNVLRCEKCKSAFTIHKHEQMQCRKCHISRQIPSSCENCKSVKLKQLGYGTEKIETEIAKIFGRAKILRLDAETIFDKKTAAVELNEKVLETADILIATQIINKPFNLPRLNLTVAVMPDSILHFPDFRTGERVFQILEHLKLLSKKEMIIQTFMPDNQVFNAIKNGSIESFYEAELESRRPFNLPPFNKAD
ncbi:MAG: primosomal protein N' [Candidatus Gracilibacteria bacterium]